MATIYRSSEFIQRLKKTKLEDVEKICILELKYLKENLKLSSYIRAITDYREDVNKSAKKGSRLGIKKLEAVLTILKASKSDFTKRRKKYEKSIKLETSNLRPVNPEAVIDKAVELLKSDSYLSLLIGLCTLSGRRSSEVLKTASFTIIDEETLLFSGQLKTKNSDNAQVKPYQIPVLCDSKLFIDAFKKLRSKKDFSQSTARTINTTVSKNLSTKIKSSACMGEIFENPKIKDLRSIYAEICFDIYARKSEAKISYFADILGHSSDDTDTARSYLDFYLT